MNQDDAKKMIAEYAHDLIDMCPHCGAKTHIEKLYDECHTLNNGSIEFYVLFRCKPCKKLLLKTYLLKKNSYTQKLEPAGWDEKFPITLDSELNVEDMRFIPENVFDDYKEALKCKSIKANKASCSMFRRTLQGSLMELGADNNIDLIKQINSLPNLPSDIKDWAHQIRVFGNWGSHPDKDNLKNIDENDVIEAHEFTSKFLIYMFIMPEKVKLSREKRENKAKEEKEV